MTSFFIFAQNENNDVTVDSTVTENSTSETQVDSNTSEKTDSAESQTDEDYSNIPLKGKIYATPSDFRDFLHSTDFLLQLSPGFYFNPYSKELKSGPAAPVYPVTFGFNWPNYTFISIQPTISYFQMYHLWYDGTAYPSEIENRTAQTYNFMIDTPAVLSLYPGKNKIQFSLGASMLIRFSTLARNVNYDDSGDSGSAGEDVNLINKWFWQNANFLYASAGVCWLRELTGTLKGGPFFSFYLPIGSLINHRGLLGSVLTLGVKISL